MHSVPRPALLVGLLLAAALAGCLGGGRHGPADDGAAAAALSPASVASYLHDLSQPIPGVSFTDARTSARVVLEHYRVATTGEVQLDTWVFRPDVPDKVPVVLTITPYYGGGIPAAGAGTPVGALAQELVPRGYAVGWSSVRGTGDSGGCFTQGGPQEAKDSAAVVQYVAQQPWSNGNVGLIGVSYDGTTPQETWVEAPDALKTVVPIAGISDLYKYNFVNGVPINIQGFGFNTYYWAAVGLAPAGLEGGAGPTDPASFAFAAAGEGCADQADVQEGGASSTVDGNKDAYWQSRDFLARLRADPGRPRAPVFYVHGLQDWNVKDHNMQDWLDAVQDTGVPFKAWLGQWPHAWPQDRLQGKPGPCEVVDGRGDACRDDWWNETLVAWFDQWLKGRDTGVLDAPAVQVQDDDGVWRHEERWPPKDVAWHTWFPDSGERLSGSPGSGSASYFDGYGIAVPAPPTPSAVPIPAAAKGPAVAVFRSEPLPADWHVSGLPRFVGNVTATGQRAALVLTLAEEAPNGTVRTFNFAVQSLNHVEDLANGKASVAGLRQQVDVRFFPADDVVHAGNRLVLYAAGNAVGSDDGGDPSVQPVSDGSTITLDLAGAWLSLPVDHSLAIEDPQPYDK